MTSKVQQGYRLLNLVWVVFEVSNSGTFYSFHGELLFKNIARTARKQLDERQLVIGVQSTPDNSNLVLTWTKIDFPWISVTHSL